MIETEVHEVGGLHGGFGSAALRECLDRISQSRTDAPATCHSGVDIDKSPDPQQVLSPNVEEDQTRESTSVKPPSPDSDQNLGSKKREKRKMRLQSLKQHQSEPKMGQLNPILRIR